MPITKTNDRKAYRKLKLFMMIRQRLLDIQKELEDAKDGLDL